MKRILALAIIAMISGTGLSAEELSIGKADIRIEQRVDGGYHLFIRKKPGMASVLITESTKDPTLRADNYAYRAGEWNAVNGDEKRLLEGAEIPKEKALWSLIDSTPEADAAFGEAFHIWIPYLIQYGYPWTRHGEVYVVDGTYLNLRAFAAPWGDYSAEFRDNPFVVKVVQKPLEGPVEGNFMKATVESFTSLSKGGDIVKSKGAEDIVPKLRPILEKLKGKSVDLVIVLDTTESMKDDIDSVRRMLIPMLEEVRGSFASFRIGMVLYKDYFEEYVTRKIEFTSDFRAFQKTLNGIRVNGGRDIPEAVHEALYMAGKDFDWKAASREVILIGDAPPHPQPRGNVTKEMAEAALAGKAVQVNAIILPQ